MTTRGMLLAGRLAAAVPHALDHGSQRPAKQEGDGEGRGNERLDEKAAGPRINVGDDLHAFLVYQAG